jgi:hypothetical protein
MHVGKEPLGFCVAECSCELQRGEIDSVVHRCIHRHLAPHQFLTDLDLFFCSPVLRRGSSAQSRLARDFFVGRIESLPRLCRVWTASFQDADVMCDRFRRRWGRRWAALARPSRVTVIDVGEPVVHPVGAAFRFVSRWQPVLRAWVALSRNELRPQKAS